jgi:hypothetical protein
MEAAKPHVVVRRSFEEVEKCREVHAVECAPGGGQEQAVADQQSDDLQWPRDIRPGAR